MELAKGRVVYANAGAAQLLGLALAASTDGWITAHAKQTKAILSIDRGGTAPISIDVAVEVRIGGAGTASLGFLPAVDSVVGGVVTCNPAIWSASGAWATYDPQIVQVGIPGGHQWRVHARRTGGDGTTSALITASILEE
jgi:hypothetical protein